jgi:hypothetical protein
MQSDQWKCTVTAHLSSSFVLLCINMCLFVCLFVVLYSCHLLMECIDWTIRGAHITLLVLLLEIALGRIRSRISLPLLNPHRNHQWESTELTLECIAKPFSSTWVHVVFILSPSPLSPSVSPAEALFSILGREIWISYSLHTTKTAHKLTPSHHTSALPAGNHMYYTFPVGVDSVH